MFIGISIVDQFVCLWLFPRRTKTTLMKQFAVCYINRIIAILCCNKTRKQYQKKGMKVSSHFSFRIFLHHNKNTKSMNLSSTRKNHQKIHNFPNNKCLSYLDDHQEKYSLWTFGK